MRALGVFLKKKEIIDFMDKADKDGSGELEMEEFCSLMTQVMHYRDQHEEMRKVFRCYDNDDDGQISKKNLQECADILDMEDLVRDENLEEMIQLADTKNRGCVD